VDVRSNYGWQWKHFTSEFGLLGVAEDTDGILEFLCCFNKDFVYEIATETVVRNDL
jgi:hypothetical protein